MEETKRKRIRGPRIYMGAPAEVVAQLKMIARKKGIHMSALLLGKAYDLIEEYEYLLKDEPADVVRHEDAGEKPATYTVEQAGIDVAGPVSEPLGETQEKADTGVVAEEKRDDEQHKGLFEGVRAIWKKNAM
ncbi:hypothetical protein [Burkholderia glumae]|uniref:hypothetical protein n=1 Tax=Burkholderia glumae TaxID=337 RepID=UPI0014639B71|nr:hypothetical protein [Burkholderia glumae]QJP73784.1 hypothetical protein HJC54_27675 [Burkholderia glumae]